MKKILKSSALYLIKLYNRVKSSGKMICWSWIHDDFLELSIQ